MYLRLGDICVRGVCGDATVDSDVTLSVAWYPCEVWKVFIVSFFGDVIVCHHEAVGGVNMSLGWCWCGFWLTIC